MPAIEHYNGLVIMGGPMGVYDNYPSKEDEEKVIKNALGKIPIIGFCLGSQLLAHVLGARVYPNMKNGQRVKEIGYYDVDLTKEDIQKARGKVSGNTDNYVDQGLSEKQRIQYTESEILRRKMADKEALTYVASKTGVPSSKFIGWDPRLTMDDIKIRTLNIGKEDLKRFGYWKKDEERMNRLSNITDGNKEVFYDINIIKEDMKSDRRMKRNIENVMFNNGFKTSKIDLVDSNYNSILVREDS